MRNKSISILLASTLLLALLLIPSLSDSATIAHWKFEEGTPGTVATGTATVIDSSGNNLNGTPIGGPIYRSNGVEFDGVDDRVHIPDNPLFQLSNFTLEAFIEPKFLDFSIIVGRLDNRSGWDPYYLAINSLGQLHFHIQDPNNDWIDLYSDVNSVALNNRVHVAATFDDASDQMKIYINGNLVASLVTTLHIQTLLDSNEEPGVGIGNSSGTQFNFPFKGIIDEVRISNVALSPSQFLFDKVPPTVTSTSPQDQATGVAVNSAVAVTFSELMNTTSIIPSTFIISDGFSNIAGNITFATVADQTVATFTATTNLSYSTTYTATITMGVTDDTGTAFAQNYIWTFTTGPVPDTTPPTVNTTVPTSGASGIGIGSTISATFSELMDTSTINQATFVLTGGGGGISGTISFATSSGRTLATLTPSSPLAFATTYTGTVTSGVEDLAGNPMASNHTWTFTTEAAPDTTPPIVISTVPDSTTSGVSTSTPITATFSETMDQSSFSPTVFILTGGGSNVPCTVYVNGATATFTPSANLAYNTEYTATVTMVVEDLAGNPMPSNHTWTFTTEGEPATSTSGGGGGGGCSVTPGNEANDQFPAGMILVSTLPVFVLFLRRKFRWIRW